MANFRGSPSPVLCCVLCVLCNACRSRLFDGNHTLPGEYLYTDAQLQWARYLLHGIRGSVCAEGGMVVCICVRVCVFLFFPRPASLGFPRSRAAWAKSHTRRRSRLVRCADTYLLPRELLRRPARYGASCVDWPSEFETMLCDARCRHQRCSKERRPWGKRWECTSTTISGSQPTHRATQWRCAPGAMYQVDGNMETRKQGKHGKHA